jgi:hypothetical protein
VPVVVIEFTFQLGRHPADTAVSCCSLSTIIGFTMAKTPSSTYRSRADVNLECRCFPLKIPLSTDAIRGEVTNDFASSPVYSLG